MANKKEVKERGGRNWKTVIPQGRESKHSDFDEENRAHKFQIQKGAILATVTTVITKCESPEYNRTTERTEIKDFMNCIISEN